MRSLTQCSCAVRSVGAGGSVGDFPLPPFFCSVITMRSGAFRFPVPIGARWGSCPVSTRSMGILRRSASSRQAHDVTRESA